MPTKDYETEKQDWETIWIRQSGLIRAGRTLYNRWWLNLLRGHTTDGTHLLEVGSGTASLHRSLSPLVHRITGLDYSPAALAQANIQAEKQKLTNCEYVEGDAHHLPFAAQSFDLVWSQGLLEHYDTAKALLEEQLRVCKPGGKVLISVPAAPSFLSLWYRLTRPKWLQSLWPWTEQRFYTEQSLSQLIASVGILPSHYHTYRLRPNWAGIVIGEITLPL